LDDVEIEDVGKFEKDLYEYLDTQKKDLLTTIATEKEITDDTEAKLKASLEQFKQGWK